MPPALTSRERILRTVGGPSCIAKNRYSLPAELPLSWQAIMNAMTNPKTEDKEQEENRWKSPSAVL